MKSLMKVALVAVAAAVVGCSRSEAAPSRVEVAHADGASKAAAAQPASARIDTENYLIEAEALGHVRAGKESTIEVRLETKGEYHLNKQYPYKFRLTEPAPEGVTFPKTLLERTDGTFEEKSGSFKVPFVAAKAGKTKIAGTLSMSVCSEANCVIEKQPIEVAVDVGG